MSETKTSTRHVLRKWRDSAGLSLREVETITGVSRTTISNIEKGRGISNVTAKRLSKYVKKPWYELL